MAMHVSFDSRTDTLQLQLRSRGGSMAKPSNLQMEVDRSAAKFFGGTMGLMSWTRFRPHSRRHVVPIIRGCVIKGDEAFKMRCYEHDLMSMVQRLCVGLVWMRVEFPIINHMRKHQWGLRVLPFTTRLQQIHFSDINGNGINELFAGIQSCSTLEEIHLARCMLSAVFSTFSITNTHLKVLELYDCSLFMDDLMAIVGQWPWEGAPAMVKNVAPPSTLTHLALRGKWWSAFNIYRIRDARASIQRMLTRHHPQLQAVDVHLPHHDGETLLYLDRRAFWTVDHGAMFTYSLWRRQAWSILLNLQRRAIHIPQELIFTIMGCYMYMDTFK